MNKLHKNSSREEILNASLCGVEFEFYSKLGLEETTKQLEDLLGRSIRIETKAHSDFQPTDKEFKIEPDMSGGKGLMELVTGALPYRNARILMIKILGWIRANGYTTERSGIHLNLSFNKDYLEDKNMISKMNTLKFILDFNENQVYKLFPHRENSVYAKSIKWVMPKIDAFHFDSANTSVHNYDFPSTKYYGINFEKKLKNYLEFRYLGGKDYEKKQDSIFYLWEMFIYQMWKSCNDPAFTEENKLELRRILHKNEPVALSLKDFRNVNKHWSKIEILVDLKDHNEIIDMYWDRMKHRVMDLITKGGMTEGIVNYDSDLSRIQVKDGKFPTCFQLEGYDFVDCEIRGNITNCELFSCKIEGSILIRCNAYQSTEIKESKVESCYIHGSCKIINSYVFGRDGIFKGKMTGGIFREGMISDEARFEDTEVVVSKKIKS
jgi:hypothetical protein